MSDVARSAYEYLSGSELQIDRRRAWSKVSKRVMICGLLSPDPPTATQVFSNLIERAGIGFGRKKASIANE
jgi:hypothetical protein